MKTDKQKLEHAAKLRRSLFKLDELTAKELELMHSCKDDVKLLEAAFQQHKLKFRSYTLIEFLTIDACAEIITFLCDMHVKLHHDPYLEYNEPPPKLEILRIPIEKGIFSDRLCRTLAARAVGNGNTELFKYLRGRGVSLSIKEILSPEVPLEFMEEILDEYVQSDHFLSTEIYDAFSAMCAMLSDKAKLFTDRLIVVVRGRSKSNEISETMLYAGMLAVLRKFHEQGFRPLQILRLLLKTAEELGVIKQLISRIGIHNNPVFKTIYYSTSTTELYDIIFPYVPLTEENLIFMCNRIFIPSYDHWVDLDCIHSLDWAFDHGADPFFNNHQILQMAFKNPRFAKHHKLRACILRRYTAGILSQLLITKENHEIQLWRWERHPVQLRAADLKAFVFQHLIPDLEKTVMDYAFYD